MHCISSTSQKKTALGHAREPLTFPLIFFEPAILLHPELFENKVAWSRRDSTTLSQFLYWPLLELKRPLQSNLACVCMWLGIGKKAVWRLLLVHVHYEDKLAFIHHQKGNGLILGGWIIFATSHSFLQLMRIEKSMGTILGAKKSFLWLLGAGVSLFHRCCWNTISVLH